jgi:Concanavalin A-like lectin/glucanases superfamily
MPVRSTRRDHDPDDEPAGYSLLWLWVLLGAGAVGLAIGAGIGLWNRRSPAEPDGAGPAPAPARSEEVRVLAGRESPPGPAAAPAISTPDGERVPAATEFPGLKFYLACDSIDDGAVIEGVSRKPVGKLAPGAELTDGVRGQALRLTAARGTSTLQYALDLGDQAEALAVPVGKPFTLAFWVRLPDAPRTNVSVFSGHRVLGNRVRGLYTYASANSGRIHLAEPDGPAGSNKWFKVDNLMPRDKDADRAGWVHLAAVRGEDGMVQTFLDGAPSRAAPQPFAAELQYTSIGLVPGSLTPSVVDIDELCLFDRALGAEELARLAGRGTGTAGPVGNPAKPVMPPVDPVAPPKKSGPAGVPSPATEFPGLKFYLACDALDAGTVTEAVSGKQVGKVADAAVVEGVRGKALRLTHDRKNPNRHALDLTDQVDALRVAAEKPFTLAFWARRVQSDQASGFGAYLLDAETEFRKAPARGFRVQMLPGSPAGVYVHLSDASIPGGAGPPFHPAHKVAEPAKWNHFALVRNEKGEIRWLVNGADSGAAAGSFTGELRYDKIGLLRSSSDTTVVDLDEFCLFDRALSDAELKKLAGLAK